jgi:DNA invertase Pin-like site-specific DNA recombinase
VNPELNKKITSEHLDKNAYLYIRQSTIKQVLENTESTKRQYALRERAVALGWSPEKVIVIDSDLGQSGAQSKDRDGFQRLVADVGMGRAGIVMGLEVSRLARNSSDWHRLLEICALSSTLILDEDGVYDPGHFNDRLLLGLKGTMSEAELHVLRSRMRGGLLNKASRGELKMRLPVGYVYSPEGKTTIDPDKQVQEALRSLFRLFQETGSAFLAMKTFNQRKLFFPKKVYSGSKKEETILGGLTLTQILRVLHNPTYAGVYFFGRTRSRIHSEKKTVSLKNIEQWHAYLPESHEGYITLTEFHQNNKRLLENANQLGPNKSKTPPREGPAFLQGIGICGKCGEKVTIRYHLRKGVLYPTYTCRSRNKERGEAVCQIIPGASIDRSIENILLEVITPASLEVALLVRKQLEVRVQETDQLRKKQLERAQYEVNLAQKRYLLVDPSNRLVADTLESQWNEKLRTLRKLKDDYDTQKEIDLIALSAEQQSSVLALASDFPKLWKDPSTSMREKKRLVRLVIEDVTLTRRATDTLVQIRFKGGTTQSKEVLLPKNPFLSQTTPSEILKMVDQLLDDHHDEGVATILNNRGYKTTLGNPFTARVIDQLRRKYKIDSHFLRLRNQGLLTRDEIKTNFSIGDDSINLWVDQGRLHSKSYHLHGVLFEVINQQSVTTGGVV